MKLILKRLRKLEEEGRQSESLPFSFEVVFIDPETKEATGSLLLETSKPAMTRRQRRYSGKRGW